MLMRMDILKIISELMFGLNCQAHGNLVLLCIFNSQVHSTSAASRTVSMIA